MAQYSQRTQPMHSGYREDRDTFYIDDFHHHEHHDGDRVLVELRRLQRARSHQNRLEVKGCSLRT